MPSTADLEILDLCHLDYRDPPRTKDLVLLHAWGVQIKGVKYVVPQSLRSDGASIPRFLWRVVDPPFFTLMRRGVILHDAAYQGRLLVIHEDGSCNILEDRARADEIMFLVGRRNGASRRRAAMFHMGVRSFGRGPWKRSHARYAHLSIQDQDFTIPVMFPVPSLN